MADTKIEVKIGAIEFSGEGDKEWLAEQLDKILDKALKLAPIVPTNPKDTVSTTHNPMAPDSTIAQQPLASFLKSKGSTTNQVKKFLAASVWLEAKGNSRLTTADVTKALKDANQTRIGNPADCLAQNIKKGHCEKDEKKYFVTEEGKASL